MRNGLSLLLLCLSLPCAQAAQWVPVLADSTLAFNAEQQGAPFEGRFSRFSADIELDPQNAENGKITAVIDMDSVDTLYDERDEALREPEWFDVERWPEARFVTERIQASDGAYMADALLTLRDTTRPVAMRFSLEQLADGQLRFVGKTIVSRLAFGVGQGQWTNTDWVGDKVTIEVNLILEQALP